MKWLCAGLLALHGLIHFLGLAKALAPGRLPQFTQAVSRPQGLLWMAAGLLLLAAAGLLAAGQRAWWLPGLAGVVLSQGLIFSTWRDARFGTVANLLLLPILLYGLASLGPWGFRAEYLRQVRGRLARPAIATPVAAGELSALPRPLRCYLEQAGVVGRERVHHFRARWRGRIRGGPDQPWMEFTAEQYNFVAEPARFFFMRARRGGLPVEVLHAFSGGAAIMRVRLLASIPLVDASGPELTRAETVTLFNDLCLLAPAALLDPGINWEELDERSVRGRYTVGANTISAVLHFNERCELVDFVSDDRLAASADGRRFTPKRWSTPVEAYRRFGPWRLFSRGRGLWHDRQGEYAYFEAELLDLQVNGPAP
ncbi:MAG: hypothetical protein DRI34_00115 [Deltaproteobacteria bacterium]|nr:MAG: hypothetical protein DRI34_00115 [Deltaproteobacteria bacterium]